MAKTDLVKKRKTEVVNLIQQAIEKGSPVETMERLFDLQEKAKASQAREAFVVALAEFQSKCPVISKTVKVNNKDGTLRYQYAPLSSIVSQVKTILADNGLSYTWEVENKTGFIKATIKATHKFGHSEVSSFEIPIDSEGYMTAPQKYASALTFAKRYTLCNVFGISTGEEDTDATDVGKEPEAKSPKSKIVLLLRTLGEKGTTKEDYEKSVKRLTSLVLEEKNYKEITARLEATVTERNEA